MRLLHIDFSQYFIGITQPLKFKKRLGNVAIKVVLIARADCLNGHFKRGFASTQIKGESGLKCPDTW